MRRRLVWAGLASLAVHWGVFQIGWSVHPVSKTNPHVPYLELTLVERAPERTIHDALPSPAAVETVSLSDVVPDAAPPLRPVERPKARAVNRKPAATLSPPQRDIESPPAPEPATGIPEASSEGVEGPAPETPPLSPEKVEGPMAKASEGAPPVRDSGWPAVRLQRALPRYDLNPRPEYPETARRRGYEGTVVVTARVLRDGTVADIRVGKGSGHELLDRAAIQAVRSWRFIPATLNEEPVEMEVDIPIRFQLE